MYWLVRINLNELEVWTDATHIMMVKKCEYYGAKPFWQEVRKLETELELKSPHLVQSEIIPFIKEVPDENYFGIVIK